MLTLWSLGNPNIHLDPKVCTDVRDQFVPQSKDHASWHGTARLVQDSGR